LAGGVVNVSKDGNEYTIEIDCVNKEGQEITGYYKGTLDYFDGIEYETSASLKSKKRKSIFFR